MSKSSVFDRSKSSFDTMIISDNLYIEDRYKHLNHLKLHAIRLLI